MQRKILLRLYFKELILFGILGLVRLYLRYIFKYFDLLRTAAFYLIMPLTTPTWKHKIGPMKFGWLEHWMPN
jgi:hypothetical protein